jgi:NADPH:quinone reductase-like Zn-dependent oxidoreductase
MEMKQWCLVQADTALPVWELKTGMLPPLPAPGHVRIAVEASGINFADALMMQGLYGDAPKTPFVPGYEVVGSIQAVGEGVSAEMLHQRIMAFTPFGGFSSMIDLPASQVVIAPTQLSSPQACALVTAYVTAWYLSEVLTSVQPGDQVLVHSAAGAVGRALMEHSIQQGARVWFSSRNPEKLQALAEEFPGQVPVLNRSEQPWWTQISADQKFDRIFDPLAGLHLAQGYKRLRPGGVLLSYGAAVRSGRKSLIRDALMILNSGIYNPITMLLASRSIATLNMLHVGRERPELLLKGLKTMAERAQRGYLRPPLAAAVAVADFESTMLAFARGERQGKLALVWNLGDI